MFSGNLLDSNEEYISYHVDSLFTSILLGETIDFILDDIYVLRMLESFVRNQFSKSY